MVFNRKKCNRCNKKISNKYNFCPYCGNPLKGKFDKNEIEDYGLLGKTDEFENTIEGEIVLPKGIEKIMNSLLKNFDIQIKAQLENPFEEELNNKNIDNIKKDSSKHYSQRDNKMKLPSFNINFSNLDNFDSKINLSPAKISIYQNPNKENFLNDEKIAKLTNKTFSKEQIEKFLKLKKQEPKSEIRRFSNSVIYELEIPKVKSIEDISIINLENSIELKAIGEDTAYTKIIPLKFPIKNYILSDGKLILEFSLNHE